MGQIFQFKFNFRENAEIPSVFAEEYSANYSPISFLAADVVLSVPNIIFCTHKWRNIIFLGKDARLNGLRSPFWPGEPRLSKWNPRVILDLEEDGC